MLVEAAWAAAKAPGSPRAFFPRIRARRGTPGRSGCRGPQIGRAVLALADQGRRPSMGSPGAGSQQSGDRPRASPNMPTSGSSVRPALAATRAERCRGCAAGLASSDLKLPRSGGRLSAWVITAPLPACWTVRTAGHRVRRRGQPDVRGQAVLDELAECHDILAARERVPPQQPDKAIRPCRPERPYLDARSLGGQARDSERRH
jgi:hypothetical protein